MAEEWTYHRLCEAYREEKGTNRLNSLPADFGRSLQELISRLGTQAGGQKELDNARKQARLLVRLRRQKLMMRASMEQEGAEPEGLTEGEKEMYGRLRQMYAQEDERLEGLMHPLPGSVEAAAAVSAGKGGPNGGSAAPAKKIKFLKEVPEYRGGDGQTYGPFSSGQLVEVPETEAKALISGSVACEIGPNGENVVYVTKAVKIKKVRIDMAVPEYTSPEGRTFGPYAIGQEVDLPEDEARFLERGSLAHELRE